jgi:CheY-like chemotaxis protein
MIKSSLVNSLHKKILIVDDIEANLLISQKILEKNLSNITCSFASNGKEAIRCFKENNPDLILMDLQMPVMDGMESTRRIREISDNIPIILYSSFISNASKIKAKEVGVDDYIPKPVSHNTLIKTVTKWLLIDDYQYDLSKKSVKEILKDKKVVLVSGSVVNNISLAENLKSQFDMEVKLVQNKDEIASGEICDAVLVDIDVDLKADQIEVVKKIRNYGERNNILTIAITQDDSKKFIHQLFKDGIDDYSKKNNEDVNKLAIIIAFWLNERNIGELHKTDLRQYKYYNDHDIKFVSSKIEGEDLGELVDVFVKSTSKLVTNIQISHKNNNIKELGFLTHSLIGVAGCMGMNSLYDFAHLLSEDIRGGKSLSDNHIEKLDKIFKETEEILMKIKNKKISCNG